MVSRFVFPVWSSLHLPWWDGSGFAFQVGRNKWEKAESSHQSKHCNTSRFKWQCTKVNDTWQKIHSWGWRKVLHNLNMLLICHWFILSLSGCCDFDSSCCFPSAPLLFWFFSPRVCLQFAASFPVLLLFFMSCKGMSSLASLSPAWEQRPGSGKYRGEVEMKERGGALSGRRLKKEAEIPVHRQMMATLIWKSPLYSQDSWGERATIHLLDNLFHKSLDLWKEAERRNKHTSLFLFKTWSYDTDVSIYCYLRSWTLVQYQSWFIYFL